MPPSGDLAALEALLKEFYLYSTSNERKHEIEAILGQFQRLPDSWQHCMAFLKDTEDAYVQMFCLIVLDNTVTQRWRNLTAEQKCTFIQFLHELLQDTDRRCGDQFSFVRNKMAKVIVEIGRIDWPHAYPDFLENVLKMLELDDYIATGLLLLRTASDELTASVATSAERRDELKRLLVSDAPRMLDRLSIILDTLLRTYRSESTSSSYSNGGSVLAFEPTRCLHLDERGLRLVVSTLQCLGSLFSWVQPSVVKTTLLFQTFSFVSGSINVIASSASSRCACGRPVENTGRLIDVCCSALGCLSELLTRSYAPPDFREFVVYASDCTYVTLCRLCALDCPSERGVLANRVFSGSSVSLNLNVECVRRVEETVLDELTKFIRVFLGTHFAALERSISVATVRDLLAAFYCYTFALPVSQGGAFGTCLDVWHTVLDASLNQAESHRSLYSDLLISLAKRLAIKMQFVFNHSELELLATDVANEADADANANIDAEESSADGAADWQTFVARSVETLAKVGSLLPAETFAVVAEPFSANAVAVSELSGCFVDDSNGNGNGNGRLHDVNRARFRVPANPGVRSVHFRLRDLATFARAIARLVPDQLCGTPEQFSARFSDGEMVVTHLVNITKMCAAKRVWSAGCASLAETRDTAIRSLPSDLVAMHTECLRALSTVSASWLAQFRSLCVSSGNTALLGSVDSLLVVLIDECVAPALANSNAAPSQVALAAAQLLLSLVGCRPARLLDTNGFRLLTERAASVDGIVSYSRAVLSALYRAIVAAFVSAQPDAVAGLFDRFVTSLSSPIIQTADRINELRDSAARQRTLRVLWALTEVVTGLHGETTRVKQASARTLGNAVECSLRLVPACADSLELLDALANLVLGAVRELKGALRPALLDSAWSSFSTLLDGARLAQAVTDGAKQKAESEKACAALSRFIELLSFVVQEASFRPRLRDVLRVALERVYAPLAAHEAFTFVRPAFYALVHDVLTNNWHFFFKQQFAFGSSVAEKTQMKAEGDSDDVPENRDQLIGLMSVLADGLVNNEPTVFRAALSTFESLHARHRLYARATFRNMMLERFIELLLGRLVDRSQAALNDEISAALFNAANAVEVSRFRAVVLPRFVAATSSRETNAQVCFSDEQRAKLCAAFTERDMDPPSFACALGRFAQDFRFYAQLNAVERDRDRFGSLFQLQALAAR